MQGTPLKAHHADDFAFLQGLNGLNVAVTGCTGNIGSQLVNLLIRPPNQPQLCQPRKIALFSREEEKMPTHVQDQFRGKMVD